jgi:hypothetical protein
VDTIDAKRAILRTFLSGKRMGVDDVRFAAHFLLAAHGTLDFEGGLCDGTIA